MVGFVSFESEAINHQKQTSLSELGCRKKTEKQVSYMVSSFQLPKTYIGVLFFWVSPSFLFFPISLSSFSLSLSFLLSLFSPLLPELFFGLEEWEGFKPCHQKTHQK